MSAPRRSNFRSAVLGMAITAAFVSYQIVTDSQSPLSRNSSVMLAFVILCPPSLLSLPFINAEVGTNAFYFLWTFIALLNAALYASVRALITKRLRRPD